MKWKINFKWKKQEPASKPHRHAYVLQRRKKRQQIGILIAVGIVLFCSGFALGGLFPMFEEVHLHANAQQQGKQHAHSVSLSSDQSLLQTSQNLPWNLLLINAQHPLAADYEAPELTHLSSGHAVDSRVYPALQDMMDGARAAGLDPVICSSFRTREKQQTLYENKVQYYLDQGQDRASAEQSATQWVQRPDTSEHQMGLAVDIVDRSYQMLDAKQEQTPVQIWLMEHCAEYGFILRYPTEKSDITGVGYEPWHYRYVGVEAAQTIMENDLCLEEYLYPELYE